MSASDRYQELKSTSFLDFSTKNEGQRKRILINIARPTHVALALSKSVFEAGCIGNPTR